MILFLFQQALRNEHGHVDIHVTSRLEHAVQNPLYILPDRIAVGTNDHTALYAGIRYEFCLFADVGVPLCKIHVHCRDLFHHFLILFCHSILLWLFPVQPHRQSVFSIAYFLRNCKGILGFVRKHCIKLVRKMRSQIFRQIA